MPSHIPCAGSELKGNKGQRIQKKDSIGSEIIPSQKDNYLIFSIGYGKEGQEKWKGMWKEGGRRAGRKGSRRRKENGRNKKENKEMQYGH